MTLAGAGQGNADAIEAGSGSFGRLREDARAAALERCLKGVTATAKLLRADPPLRSLHLCKCGLGNLSVRAVAESLMANSQLHELLLGENAIGDAGVRSPDTPSSLARAESSLPGCCVV